MIAGVSEDASGPRLVLTLGDWDEVKAFPAVSTTGPISGSTLNRPLILDTLTSTLLDDFNIMSRHFWLSHWKWVVVLVTVITSWQSDLKREGFIWDHCSP